MGADMRAVSSLVIAAVALPAAAPVAAAAQGRDQEAVPACGYAVPREVREQYPQAYGVRILDSLPTRQGRGEISVMGKGEFQDRNGGAARFDYSCVYDARAGRAYGLDVYGVRPKRDPNDKKDNSAAIAGLVLGAIVVGAIAASQDDDDKGRVRDRETWSPAAGVRCNSRNRSCYEDGRYSRYWTNRIFVGGR